MSEKTAKKDQIFELPPDGRLEPLRLKTIAIDDTPQAVQDRLKYEMSFFEITWSEPWLAPKIINFGDGGQAYVFAYIQNTNDEGYQERTKSIYTVDVNTDGQVVGSGNSAMYLNEDEVTSEGAKVRFTSTEPEFRGRGLGLRRLIVLNQANKFFFRKILGSGEFDKSEPYAEMAWERLCQAGLTSKGEFGSYKFN